MSLDTERRELEFWQATYVAAISAGKSSRHAVGMANEAINDLRERLQVIAVNDHALSAA